jgi:hypothetical protein
MTERSEKLALRRQSLMVKIQAQRQLLNLQTQDLQQNIVVAELGFSLGRIALGKIRKQPLLGVALGAALIIIKPARLLTITSNTLQAWRIWREVAPMFKPVKFKPVNGKPEQTES